MAEYGGGTSPLKDTEDKDELEEDLGDEDEEDEEVVEEDEELEDEAEKCLGMTGILDGVDLMGDTQATHSNWFAMGVFSLVALFAAQLYLVVSNSELVTTSEWSSLLLFLFFLAFSFLSLVVAAPIAAGNSAQCMDTRWLSFSAFYLIFFYFAFMAFRAFVTWKPWAESAQDGEANYTRLSAIVFVEAFILVLTLLLLADLCCFGRAWMAKSYKKKKAVVLFEDEDGCWEEDDVRGFIRHVGVQNDYFDPKNDKFIAYPGLGATCKEFFWPQPFEERDKFPNSEVLREAASRAQVAYPPRFRCSCITVAVVMILTLLITLGISVPIALNAALLDPPLQKFEVFSNFTRDAAEVKKLEVVLAATQANLTKAIATDADSDILFYSTQNLTLTVAIEVAKVGNSVSRTMYDLIKHLLHTGTIALVVASPLVTLVCLWFVGVSPLAYRKGILELIASRPHYRFHPQWHNFLSDKKFIGMYVSCFILVYVSLLVITWILFAVISWINWIDILKKYFSFIIATIIYYVLSLLVIPNLVGCMVSKNGRLTRPRLNAAFVFVWEIFYVPQMAISVVLHVVCANVMVIFMLLRPDQFMMRIGWEWLDMMFFVYGSMQYEQVQTGIRKYERWQLSDGSASEAEPLN